jgi:hypothetical protein
MAKDRFRIDFSTRDYENPWEAYETYCTTGEFAKLGKRGYVRHCGPTAMTNLILTLKKREAKGDLFFSGANGGIQQRDLLRQPINELFEEIAATGQRMLVFANMDLFGRLGGTSDILAGLYLRRLLNKYRLNARVKGHFPLTEHRVRSAVERGSLLYLELHRHPRYQNHHLICYTAEEVFLPGSSKEVGFYLKCADGWGKQPVCLTVSDMLPGSSFIEVEYSK